MTPIVPEHRSGLSRRTVLAGAAGLAGLGLLTLSGCTLARSNPTFPEAAETGTAARGGRLGIARPAASAAETLDSASSLSAYEYLGALDNRLVKLDEQGITVPDLAEEWSATPEGVTWTFRLRPGVTFHDGRRLTAADAIYSTEQIFDPDTGSPQGEVLAAMIGPGRMSTPDPLTLRFELLTATAEFPSLLTAYQCYIVLEGRAESGEPNGIGTSGIGTGPVKLSSFEPAGTGSIEAFEDHFAGRPVLDGIDFSSIQDTTARVNALLAGQIDLLPQTNLDFATAQVVSASSTATVARCRLRSAAHDRAGLHSPPSSATRWSGRPPSSRTTRRPSWTLHCTRPARRGGLGSDRIGAGLMRVWTFLGDATGASFA